MRTKFDEKMMLRLPHELTELLSDVANRRMVSRSAYARQAVLEKLERDGFCVVSPMTVERIGDEAA